MKISIISTTTFPTPPVGYGGEVVIYDLAHGLHELGHEIILYAAKNDNINYPFKINKLRNTYAIADWNAEKEALYFYEEDLLNSDVILDMSHGKTTAQELFYLRNKKEVACYLIGNYWARPHPPFNIIVNSKKQLQLGINGMTGFEGTPFEKEHFSSGSIPATSKYIHLGVNTEFYEFNPDKEDYFLWMGRFHPWKGTDIAIQLAKDTEINLVITGGLSDSPDHVYYGKQYLKLIEGYENIKYVPLPQDETHQYKKMELMRNARGFLNPIRFHESFGLVNVEALSCGTPVITHEMGALKEIIKHGETGFLCHNYEEMKNYVRIIDEIKPENCRKDVEKRFSRQVMAKNYESIFKELMEGKSW